MAFALDNRLGTEYGSCTTDGTAGRGNQGGVFVYLQQLAQEDAQEDGAANDDAVYQNGRETYGGHIGQRQAETVEYDTGAQNLFRTEFDTRHPGLGQPVAQAVGVEHAQYDTHDERTEREIFYKLDLGDVESRKREEYNQKNTMKYVSLFFVKHNCKNIRMFCFVLLTWTAKRPVSLLGKTHLPVGWFPGFAVQR